MPAPRGKTTLVHTAVDVGRQGSVRPLEHRLVIEQDAPHRTDGWRVRHRIGQIDVMAIGDRQRAAHNLMHADEQLRSVRCGQHFIDHTVDRLVAKRVNGLEALLLLAQSSPQGLGGVRVIEDVATRLDLDLEFRNGERPGAQSLRQTSLEIEEPQQPPRVLLDAELSAQGPLVAWEPVGKSLPALGRRLAALRKRCDGIARRGCRIGCGIAVVRHGTDLRRSEFSNGPRRYHEHTARGLSLDDCV